MVLTDLRELKKLLDLDADDASEDVKLSLYAEWATGIIEEYLNRKLALVSRTEYYAGNNTPKLKLRERPVVTTPIIVVHEDRNGLFGQTSGSFDSSRQLVFGKDFGLQVDQPDGSSRCGILVKPDGVWERPVVRQRGLLSPYFGDGFGTIRVTYSGGYTPDTLPTPFRAATVMLVSRLRYLFPLGMPIGSESYEERHISLLGSNKDWLMDMVKPLLRTYRNWSI